ncbi:Uncharacterised protein [Mycobacterium tuberculosis]|nr:Uncharacterised protein [Mycobacterium tuberculosis]
MAGPASVPAPPAITLSSTSAEAVTDSTLGCTYLWK